MANGSHSAKLRRSTESEKRTGRRLLILGWITAVGLPGAADAVAQEVARTPRSAAVSQAIAVGEPQRGDAVAQTAGGLLGQLFGSPSDSGGSSKDDGRRAYPLPPPDPASVNWNGVPYHAPKPGSIAASASTEEQPIRDVAAASRAQRPAANAGPGAKPSALPQPPQPLAAAPAGASARIAAAVPLPPAKLSADASMPELSTQSSSRRRGRRQIDPLSPDELLTATEQDQRQASAPAADAPGIDLQGIARREMPAAGPSSPTQTQSQTASSAPPPATATTATAIKGSAAPAMPPSLAAIDAKLAAQQAQSNKIAKSSADATTAKQPSRPDAAVPPPVSRTEPMVPAPGTQAYPPETIAAELSPLRPIEAEAAQPKATQGDAYIGSGVAAIPAPPVAAQSAAQSAAQAAAGQSQAALPSPVAAGAPSLAAAGPANLSSPTGEDAPIEIAAPESAAPESAEFVARGQVAERSQMPTNSSSSKQLAASEMPGIRVVTEGPSEILIRELTQYEVRVENRGSQEATGVVVRTSLPPWAEVKGHNASSGMVKPLADDSADAAGQLEWTVEHLPAGVVERLFVRIQPTGAGTFNVATNWTTLPQTHIAQVTVREPKLALEIEGPDEIIYGQSQKYRVRVLNPGDAVAANVRFKLAPAAGEPVEQMIGNIPAGKDSSFEIELTARDLGELKINGSATADLELTAAAHKSVRVAAAKIEATLSGPPLKFQNTDAAYQLTLTNRGQAASEAVVGEVQLPPGVKYVGGIAGASVEGDRLSWTVGALPPGETKQYAFTCKMEQTGTHPLAFHCTGSAAGRASVEIETAVQAIVDLKLSVLDPPAPAPVGSEVAYEVMLNNRGSKAAENVRVVAQFGNGIEPVAVEGHTGDVVTGQVLFHAIPRIEPGGQIKLKIAAKADRAGDHRFRVEMRSGETVLIAEEATVFVEIRNERISRSSSNSSEPENR